MALNSLHCAEVPLRNCSLIHLFQMQGQKILRLIDREVIILKSVSHENIIELKEVFETAQVCFGTFTRRFRGVTFHVHVYTFIIFG